MSKPNRPPSGRTNLASCAVATIFLVFVVIVVLIVFFTVFKPKDPKISVNAVQFPSFSVANGTVNFTFSQYVAVSNPNRAVFSHYDSSLQLLYSGGQVGFMFIPAGEIDSGQTQFMAATFSVKSFPLSAAATQNAPLSGGISGGISGDGEISGGIPGDGGISGTGGISGAGGGRFGPVMEIETRMEMAGRVRVLHFFTHHVEARADCKVAIAVGGGAVLGFHC